MASRLADALASLPPSYREVFVLHHQRELSYEEIARITGDLVGSLKVRAHRARQLLKERVFDEDPSNGASTSDRTAPPRGREGGMP